MHISLLVNLCGDLWGSTRKAWEMSRARGNPELPRRDAATQLSSGQRAGLQLTRSRVHAERACHRSVCSDFSHGNLFAQGINLVLKLSDCPGLYRRSASHTSQMAYVASLSSAWLSSSSRTMHSPTVWWSNIKGEKQRGKGRAAPISKPFSFASRLSS